VTERKSLAALCWWHMEQRLKGVGWKRTLRIVLPGLCEVAFHNACFCSDKIVSKTCWNGAIRHFGAIAIFG